MKEVQRNVALVILLVIFTPVATADVVWPSAILEGRLLTWWAILFGLIVEGFVLYRWFKLSIPAAALADVAMNAASTLIGYFAIPWAGYGYELGIARYLYRFGLYTFNPLAWLVTVVGAAAINTVIELAVLKIGWKIKYTRSNFGRLLIANIVSVALAFVSLMVRPPEL